MIGSDSEMRQTSRSVSEVDRLPSVCGDPLMKLLKYYGAMCVNPLYNCSSQSHSRMPSDGYAVLQTASRSLCVRIFKPTETKSSCTHNAMPTEYV